MNKDTVPENYAVSLAAFDLVPVLLFGLACILLWRMTGSLLVLIGGVVCFISGMLKVIWKLIVVIGKKNVWPLFVQMRIGMPAGLTVILIGFILRCLADDMSSFWNAALRPAPVFFALLHVLGMAAMIAFSSRLDAAEARANWIEQGCNTLAQGAFLITVLLVFLNMEP